MAAEPPTRKVNADDRARRSLAKVILPAEACLKNSYDMATIVNDRRAARTFGAQQVDQEDRDRVDMPLGDEPSLREADVGPEWMTEHREFRTRCW
jgi:hypothetical protein